MTLTSNIDRVLAQVSGVRAEVPRAVARALRPEHWRNRAREVAEAVLKALATPEEQPWVTRFVNVITAIALGGQSGFILELESPVPPLTDAIAAARSARAATSPLDRGMGLFNVPLAEFEQLILEWVETAKRKDARDAGKTDAEIADLITYLLLSPDAENLTVRSGKNEGRNAREVLTPHIADFLQTRSTGLPPETVDLWLRSIMAAWVAMVKAELAARVRAELMSKKFP